MTPACNAYRAYRPLKGRRNQLATTAALAIAIALANPDRAWAQFNGSGTPASGTVSGVGTNNIVVGSSTATIDWTATTNDFLPSNATQGFSSTTLSDYTVLNRITPADPNNPIQLNGTLTSTVMGGSTGGNIWFYAPSGILIGSGAVINVGGLLLTSLTIDSWSADSSGFTADFSKQVGDGGTITNNATGLGGLTASNYIAIVAPRVVQAGEIRVGQSAALVAAENLTMTMDQGLFNIEVDVDGGTNDGNGIVHSGSTTGPTTGQNIYMVAVPKNLALTMLLGGTIGFDATSATELNGRIILSSGWAPNYDINDELYFSTYSPETKNASIDIGPGTFTSDVTAIATQSVSAIADTGSIDFAGDIIFQSTFGAVSLEATGGNNITVGDFAGLYTFADPNLGENGGGDVTIDADLGGSIDIVGNLYIDVSAIVASGDASGGTVTIEATNNSSITTGGVTILANAQAGDNGDGPGGDATGGDVLIRSASGGSISTGEVFANVSGTGGDTLLDGYSGGRGDGGTFNMVSGEGTILLDGSLTVFANGTGGQGGAGVEDVGGTGEGGEARLFSEGTSGGITVNGSVDMFAGGYGGEGHTGGFGQGGKTGISAVGGTIDVNGPIQLFAEGVGGDAAEGFGGMGGDGTGGLTYIEADTVVEGSTVYSAGTITGGNATLNSDGHGGTGGAGNGDNIAAGTGGTGTGGTYSGFDTAGSYVLTDAAGGSVTLANVNMSASGFGGTGGLGGTGQVGGDGGTGYGGTAQAGNYNPNEVTDRTGISDFADLTVIAAGQGGAGGAGDNGDGGADHGDGGDGIGGYTLLSVSGTTIANNVLLIADGIGGVGANGGDGNVNFGEFIDVGVVEIYVAPDSEAIITGNIDASAHGIGGAGLTGNGGDGYGGEGYLTVAAGGTLDGGDDGNDGRLRGGNVIVRARGEGGAGGSNGGAGGTGFGGDVSLDVAGSMKMSDLQMILRGVGGAGGSGANGGDGGDGFGGNLLFQIGGSADLLNVLGLAIGEGGNGGVGTDGDGGDGGIAFGGDTQTVVQGSLIAESWQTFARAFGGDGGTGSTDGLGGDAFGGTASIDVLFGATVDIVGVPSPNTPDGIFLANATAFGGNGSDGGDGFGGEFDGNDRRDCRYEQHSGHRLRFRRNRHQRRGRRRVWRHLQPDGLGNAEYGRRLHGQWRLRRLGHRGRSRSSAGRRRQLWRRRLWRREQRHRHRDHDHRRRVQHPDDWPRRRRHRRGWNWRIGLWRRRHD